jgi:hypothetical protein
MRVDDILPALDLPAAAVKNTSIRRSSLLEGGVRHLGDKQRIMNEIASIRWLAAINAASTGILPHVHPGREYHDIGILAVEPRPNVTLDHLAEAIHSLVPNPIVLFFFSANAAFQVSVAHKRRPTGVDPRPIIDGERNACPLSDTQVDAAFFRSLRWSELPQRDPQGDLFGVYRSWNERVDALKTGRLTGEFNLCETAAQVIHRRRLLAEYVRQFRKRRWSRRHLADEFGSQQRATINGEIERTNATLKSLRNQLRNMFDSEANEGARNVGEPKVVLASDDGSMTLPALP